MVPSIYINLEDDVSQIAARLQRERSSEIVLVCPKRCFLFSDSINLRLLKKKTDLLKKKVFVLTMDERGQLYSKEAGFELRFLSKAPRTEILDIRAQYAPKRESQKAADSIPADDFEDETLAEEILRKTAKIFSPKIVVKDTIFAQKELDAKINRAKRAKTPIAQKIIGVAVSASLVLLLVVFFFILPKATVVIYPKTEVVARDLEISLSTNAPEADPNRLIMPAVKISETLEIKKRFSSKGKKQVGSRASGNVQIYNFSKQTLNLKAVTTTLTVAGKTYFFASDALQIRPTAFKSAKTKEIDENTLMPPMEIVAAEGGENYNLPEGVRFEITNKVFGSQPKLLYAKSSGAIIGGTTRFLSVVSEQEIAEAKEALLNELVANLNQELKAKDLVLIPRGYRLSELKFETDKGAGSESPVYEAIFRARVLGLAFSESQLKKMILERLAQTLPKNKIVEINQNTKINFQPKADFDLDNEVGILSAHFEGLASNVVAIDNLALQLAGKKQSEVYELLQTRPEIEKIDVFLAPDWQKNFPHFSSKIQIRLEK